MAQTADQEGKGGRGAVEHDPPPPEFETDPLPRFVEDGTAIFVNGVNLSGLPAATCSPPPPAEPNTQACWAPGTRNWRL
ncbi:MAG: hypothetical protein IPH64_20265 [Comamonadaceae bacterium]|nr:hypothetical protein [Comamonadaceae bacterium]